MTSVVILQRVLPHYRVAFFQQLLAALAQEAIDVTVVVGQGTDSEMTKRDNEGATWVRAISNRYIALGRGGDVVWQPALGHIRGADLVIVEQASRLLVNHVLFVRRLFGGPKLAFWGHGVNRDLLAASRFGEGLKRFESRHADWVFCYTRGTRSLLAEQGVPPSRMTAVQNSTDTRALRAHVASVSHEDRVRTRRELGADDGPIALALGSLYPAKRPAFLIDAADTIRAAIPNFHLVIAGDGPDRLMIDEAAASRPWMHAVGMVKGAELARLASSARLLLNPGLVGLSVVDSFALGIPMVTCELDYHSPEVEYIVDGENGVRLPSSTTPADYGQAVVQLLRDEARLAVLAAGSRASADSYSIEAMVDNFVVGVKAALAKGSRRG